MTESLDARVNARVPTRVKQDLAALAKRRRMEESELARTLLDESLRRENHPGVVFRETAVGREAAIEGRRLYVWQVVETVWASEGEVSAAADYLELTREQVEAALAYAASYPDEIEELIRLNQEDADRAHTAWTKQQQVRRH